MFDNNEQYEGVPYLSVYRGIYSNRIDLSWNIGDEVIIRSEGLPPLLDDYEGQFKDNYYHAIGKITHIKRKRDKSVKEITVLHSKYFNKNGEKIVEDISKYRKGLWSWKRYDGSYGTHVRLVCKVISKEDADKLVEQHKTFLQLCPPNPTNSTP